MTHSLVAAGIAIRGGRMLLVQRPQGGACAGLWEFPGGKVEEGEAPLDALAREWKEELGVTRLENGRIICQTHAAVFDAETGLCLSGPCAGESLRDIPILKHGAGWAVTPSSHDE